MQHPLPRPMLASRSEPFHRPGWVYEEKADGWRCLVVKDGRNVRLVSRHGRDLGDRFPGVAWAVAGLKPSRVVLDGELAVFDAELVSRFEWLHGKPPGAVATPPVLWAFDLLSLEGRSVMGEPLRVRRQLLEEVLAGAPAELLPARRLTGSGFEAFAAMRDGAREGLVAKREDSPYVPGVRSSTWLKVKVRREEEVLLCGLIEETGKGAALVVGEARDGGVFYRGEIPFGWHRELEPLLDTAWRSPQRLPGFPRRARCVLPQVRLLVSHHGKPGGLLRNGVLRQVLE